MIVKTSCYLCNKTVNDYSKRYLSFYSPSFVDNRLNRLHHVAWLPEPNQQNFQNYPTLHI